MDMEQIDHRPEEFEAPHEETGTEWNRWTRRLAIIILMIGAVFAATLLGSVLSNVVVAFILAFALFFPVRALTRRLRLNYGLSVLVVFIIYLVVATSIVGSLITSVIPFVTDLAREGQRSATILLEFLQNYEPGDATILGAEGEIANVLDALYQPLSQFVRTFQFARTFQLENVSGALPTLMDTAGVAAGTISSAIGNIFLVNLLAVLFLLEIPGIFKWGLGAIQPVYRREMAILLNRIGQVWTGFFRGQLIIAGVIGLLTGAQLMLMGIPGGVVIGLFTALVSLIPLLGGFIALFAILLVTAIQGSSTLNLDTGTLLLLAIVPNLIIQQIIWNVVAPKITGDAVSLPVPVIILGLIIGAQIGGLLGALLAAPVMGILRVIVVYVLRKIQGGDPYPDEPEPAWITTGLFIR